jgi:methionyl-tRNA formyltransferase
LNHKKIRFSFAFIGGITMIIKCADHLINRGHSINWILPRSDALTDWAQKNGVTIVNSQQEVLDYNKPTDYIFSIANDLILKEAIFKVPLHKAINLHYALLPKYAGVFSNAWALINGEKFSGITWHEIISRVDAGNIVVQKKFSIPDTATAYDLNLIARKLAFETFKNELVPAIEQRSLKSIPQDLASRSYNSLHKRPPGNGIFSWNTSAFKLLLLCKALRRGPIENSFELARFQFGNSFVIINNLEIICIDPVKPGVVFSIDKSGIIIGTGTYPVKCNDFKYPSGEQIGAFEWAKINNLAIGDKLPVLSSAYLKEVELLFEEISRNENYCKKAWVNALKAETDINWDTISQKTIAPIGKLKYAFQNNPDFIFILAGFLLSIGNTKSETAIMVENHQSKIKLQKVSAFCNYSLPLSIKLNPNQSLALFLTEIKNHLNENYSRGVHGKDMCYRRNISIFKSIDIAFEVCESLVNEVTISAPLVLRCELKTGRFQLLSFPDTQNKGIEKNRLTAIQNQLIDNCEFILNNPSITVGNLLKKIQLNKF